MNIKSRPCFFLPSIVFIIIFFTPGHLLSSDRGRFIDPAGHGYLALFLFPFFSDSIFQTVSLTKKSQRKEEMKMYKKIMVPLDGSELAECVLPHVKVIARGCSSGELILLRVVEPERLYSVSHSPIEPNLAATRESERRKAAGDYLDAIANRLSDPGLTCTVKAIVGRVAESLVDYCAKNSVDLIIIATHGRSGITRWVRGSVADKILRSSKIPVMIVRAPGTEDAV